MIKFLIIILITFSPFVHKHSFSNDQDRIFGYLQYFDSLKSDFIQVNNNGDVLSGKIYVMRPGRVRIEYTEIPILIIGDGKKVATINKKLKNITFYNINDIPIGLLLFKKFKTESITILNIRAYENQVIVKLTDKKFQDHGYIEILFEKKPFVMKKWTVFRNDHSKTEILLNNLKFNEQLFLQQFDIDYEDPRPPLGRK
tara:strand:+ start:489 stop:1085 length:597 start_codon:yes stop_codon:yes gene_type:complete